jgi:hypothetical protein
VHAECCQGPQGGSQGLGRVAPQAVQGGGEEVVHEVGVVLTGWCLQADKGVCVTKRVEVLQRCLQIQGVGEVEDGRVIM